MITVSATRSSPGCWGTVCVSDLQQKKLHDTRTGSVLILAHAHFLDLVIEVAVFGKTIFGMTSPL